MEDFLTSMPSPPDPARVKSCIFRLEELGALGSDGRQGARARERGCVKHADTVLF